MNVMTINISDLKQFEFVGPDPIRKIKGKLVHTKSEIKIHNVQLFILAKVSVETKPIIVATGYTDKEGNFSLPYPNGNFVAAFLKVTISDELPPIVLKDNKFPTFAYGGFETIDLEMIEDCSCKDNTPRLPDEEDFALSSTYSQDIGGSCTNFTTPNRALEEFSYYSIVRLTDPTVNLSPDVILFRLRGIDDQIQKIQKRLNDLKTGGGGLSDISTSDTKTGSSKLSSVGKPVYDTVPAEQMESEYQFNIHLLQQLQKEREQLLKTGRKEISLTSPVNWEDDTINSNQATSLAFGHLLHWKQVWRADGYSLGDLVYSLPLAPGQKKNIAIMDWSRKEVASRSEEMSYEDSLTNSISRDRDINEIVNTVLTEAMSANSESKIKSNSWSIGASVSVPAGPVSIGVSGGYSSTNSSGSSNAEQNAARELAASTMQNIRDKSMQSASSVRSQRSTVITSLEQSESMRVETETLANYNHCHAITIQYFEVLRHFALHTELADVQECVFIPLIMTKFDVFKTSKWKDTLISFLRVNGREQFRWYNKGLEACVKEIAANNNLALAYNDLPQGAFCDETIKSVWGTFKVRLNVTRPSEVHPTIMTDFTGLPQSAVEHLKTQALINNPDDRLVWETQLGFIDNWESIRRKVYGAAANQRDQLFSELTSGPEIAEQIISKLPLWLSKNNGNSPSQRFTPSYRLVGVSKPSKAQKMRGDAQISTMYEFAFTQKISFTLVRKDLKSLIISSITKDGSMSLQMPGGSFFVIDEVKIQYQTNSYSDYLVNASGIADDLNKLIGVSYDILLNRSELRNLRLEYQQAKNDLLRHLNENLEYYHKVLWNNMDADKRLMMLEGFQVEVPGRIHPGQTTPEPNEYRSLASVVENKIISIVGNSIVMPVARGFNLNSNFRFDTDMVELEDGKKVSKLHNYYMPDGYYKSAPYRISVPTRGVFGEAISGACNSCEKIDDSRYWKWEEHPIPDSPTAIDPISMNGRRAEIQNLTPSQMNAGLINQSAPLETVDPTGLSEAISAISNANAFRDLTGLAGNQANALAGMNATQAALKNTLDNSLAMAKQATDMYKFQQNLKNSDKIEDKINNDKNLSKEEKKELLKKHYNQLLGGEDTDQTETGNAIISKLIDKTVGSNKGKMNYTAPDGSKIDMEFEDENVASESESASTSEVIEIDKPTDVSYFNDYTEEVDDNDPNYIANRAAMDQMLTDMKPDIDNLLNANLNPPMA
jgi:hypothetical protein